MEKIKACPYCGSEEGVLFSYFGEPIVGCGSCNAHGPEANNDNDAILLWNAAANALAAKDAEIEELKELQIRLEEQNRQYSMNWQTELRRVGASDKRQDELEAEIEQLREALADANHIIVHHGTRMMRAHTERIRNINLTLERNAFMERKDE